MKYPLDNKKVLYIAPRFFGYENEIKNELERRGAKVDFLLDRPFESAFMKAVTRFRRDWVIGAANKYYRQSVSALNAAEYDFVFVISGQTLSAEVLEEWRSTFVNAKFVLYMWDSFANRQSALDNLKFFDSVLSFDRTDADKYGLRFRPLFFSSGFEQANTSSLDIDVSFIGTAHSDRYSVVSKVDRCLGHDVKKHWYLFLQAKWVYWAYLLINPTFRSAKIAHFKFESLAKQDVQAVFNSSKAILDVEHPHQTGLTMRTLETLGARKKLITTNSSVKTYDFYSEQNICVIDRLAPEIPNSFLHTEYKDVSPELYQKYRLEGWLDEILQAAEEDGIARK
ncbi:hypothetical protein EXN22_20340 [Pseudomonas tructae]|uniref:Eps11J n=1 Tax=Pseudomonas tructae TaxID=2518644 RepID=A0A411MM41_9PSED|nr:hypothetical protein [Pseudomonas tructae]QBF27916.1 hypothetical protein EXN22_20340 [Pseudomonas tructae]